MGWDAVAMYAVAGAGMAWAKPAVSDVEANHDDGECSESAPRRRSTTNDNTRDGPPPSNQASFSLANLLREVIVVANPPTKPASKKTWLWLSPRLARPSIHR